MFQLMRFFNVLLFLALFPLSAVYAQDCQTDYPQTTSTERFEIHVDSTVTDKQTGLIWKRCLQGLSGDDCSQDSFFSGTWEEALQEAENNEGWRLPNIKELQSIVERQCTNPALNTQIFPNSEDFFDIWSSSPHGDSRAWYVHFGSGIAGNETRLNTLQVRLVRNP